MLHFRSFLLALIFLILNRACSRRGGHGGGGGHGESVDVQALISKYNGKVIKGNRNALYLIQNGTRRQFPDFWTFTNMSFTIEQIIKVPEVHLEQIPLGSIIPKIQAPPAFRPDDYFFHEYCDNPDRMVNDVGVLPTMGNFFHYASVIKRVKSSRKLEIVALGGSITAGGYFEEFARRLRFDSHLNVTVYNHGHGATEITYSIYCVDIERYTTADMVLIDFSVNDYGHPKLMDALIRKCLSMPSSPLVVLVNLWAHQHCPTTRYLLHGFYYQLPIINMCPAINLCYGKKHLPQWRYEEYSKTDGVHPWGPKGVPFIGGILYAWWKRYQEEGLVTDEILDWSSSSQKSLTSSASSSSLAGLNTFGAMHAGSSKYVLPPPLYLSNPIGACTRCDALVDDADSILTPVDPPNGFRIVTRMKVGYGGFNPNDKNSSTKSFKRSWQADKAGATISFRFYGTSVRVAMWQRRDGMGILHATVDGDEKNIAKASGFFKGFTWAMHQNNTGRSEIVTLFEGLEDKEHIIKFTVSNDPANTWCEACKGHTSQIFALLSASNDPTCKSHVFTKIKKT